MEIFIIIGLVLLLFFFSNSSKSNTKSSISPEHEQWWKEVQNGTTKLTLGNWRAEKSQKINDALIENEQQIFNESVQRGQELQHVKRRGTARQFRDFYQTYTTYTKSFGIHPEEVLLILREKSAKKLIQHSIGSSVAQDERSAASTELLKIDYDWCVLNNRLLDEFYAETVKSIGPDDFSLKYYQSEINAKFPFCAGQWLATSKNFGLKIYDGSISPITGTGTSKNQAIAIALDDISSKKNILVSIPFDPMDASL